MCSITTIHIDARSVPQNTATLIQGMVKNARVKVSDYAPDLSSDTLIVTACRDMAEKYRQRAAKVCFISKANKGQKQTADIAQILNHLEKSVSIRRAAA